MLREFANQLQLTQTNMLKNWQAPMGLAVHSFSQFVDLAIHQWTELSDRFAVMPGNQQDIIRNTLKKTPSVTTGQVAVVTGGTGGIGTDICKCLAKHGHTVIATYAPEEAAQVAKWQQQQLKYNFDFDIIECDVADFKACRKMAKALEQRYEHIDILVNCAGITRDATLKKMDEHHWHAVLDTNLDGVFNVTRNLIDNMIKNQYGRIINISSVNGHKGQFGQTNYSASKAGLLGFTKSLARELADNSITVNTVSPGYVDTAMVAAIPENIKSNIIANIPMKRLAKPSEIADAVAFLARPQSSYITGSDIPVNGGLLMG